MEGLQVLPLDGPTGGTPMTKRGYLHGLFHGFILKIMGHASENPNFAIPDFPKSMVTAKLDIIIIYHDVISCYIHFQWIEFLFST